MERALSHLGLTDRWREAAGSVSWRTLAAMILLLAPLAFYNYLLFHTLAEVFSIVVAAATFAVAWRAYPFSRNDFLMYLGISLFWVGGLDLIHTLLYKGVGVFPGADANHPTQMWIATRYLQAATLLAAPVFLVWRLDRVRVFIGLGAVSVLICVAVITGHFPDAYIEGQGLTRFKIASEYAIIGLLAASVGFLWSRRSLLDDRILLLIAASMVTTMFAEFAFTFYVSVYGLSNLVGHLFKLVAYWLIYSALVDFALTQPFRTMAREASTYDAVPEAIAVIDRRGVVRQVNRTAASIVGLVASACAGRHCHDLFHPAALPQSECPVCRHIGHGDPVGEVELEATPGGRWHEFTLSPISWSDASGGLVHVRRDITDRRLRERQSHWLAAIVESSDDAIIGKSLDGTILSWNAGAEHVYGYVAREAIGRPISMLSSPDRADEMPAILERVRRGEQVVNYETVRRRKNGVRIHVSLTVSPIRSDDGAISGASTVARDITRRKEAEEALRRSAAEIEDLYNNAPCGYHSLDRDGRFVRINDTELAWLGYTRDEIIGTIRFADLLSPSSLAVFHENFSRLMERGEVRDIEYEMVRRDGGILPVLLSSTASRDGEGNFLMSRSTMFDNTERKRASELLHESENRLRRVVETVPDILYHAVLPHHEVRFVSPGITDLLGFTPQEWMEAKDTWIAQLHAEDRERVLAEIQQAVDARRNFQVEYRIWHRDRSRFLWFADRATVEADAKNGTVSLFGIMRDTTRRKNAEEELQRLNRTLRSISACNDALVRATDEQHLLEEMCRIIVDTGGYRMAWVGYPQHDEAKSVRPVAQCGFDAGYLDSLRITWADTLHGLGPSGTALRTGTIQIVRDTATDTRFEPWRQHAHQRGYRANAAFPLAANSGKVLGMLSIYAAEVNAFADEEVQLLRGLADDLAFGIEALRNRHERERTEERLRDSEERYRTLVEAMAEGVVLQDASGMITACNKSTERILGLRSDELLGQSTIDHDRTLIREDGEPVADDEGPPSIALRTGIPQVDVTLGIQRRDGTLTWVRGSCLPQFRAGESRPYAVVSTFHDITERKAQAEKIARLSRIRAVLSGINSTIVRVRDRQELFNEACRIAVEHGNFGIAWIGAVDQATLRIAPVAWAGADAEAIARTEGTSPDDVSRGTGVLGCALRDRKSTFSNDISADAGGRGQRRKAALRRGYRSLVALPLFVEGEVFGLLSLFAREPNFFDEDELRLLNELAADISFALEHIANLEKVNYLAFYDLLTGLPNRALFAERLAQHLKDAERGGRLTALVMVNVERFRNINDTLGRQAGDTLLRLIAQRMAQAVGEKGNLARIEADRFAFLRGELTDAAEVGHFIEREIDGCFSDPFRIDGVDLRVSVRLGIGMFPSDGGDADSLYRNAEIALVRAKDNAEHYLFYAPEMNAQVARTLDIENRLRHAIVQQQFVLHYQPKVNSRTGAISGVEALIRWNDPERGLVPPAHFVPVLEQTGLILAVGGWALNQAVHDYTTWRAKGLRPPRIAVNVSPIQLRHKGFIPVVQQAISSAPGGDHGLDLEITESLIMTDVERNIETLAILRKMGVGIAIDDFGTGYSSLRYISQLPVDALKIDRSFITNMLGSPDDTSIVSTIIALGHDLELKVVGEGVETEEQAKLVRLLKCDEWQGFLFSKPVPADGIEVLLTGEMAVS